MKKIFNNSLSIKNVNETVTLYGWVNKIRKLGGLIFIDLRDRSGIVQIRINEDNACFNKTSEIKNEYVLEVTGVVEERESKNKNIDTGDIEVVVNELKILNTSEVLPFEIGGSALETTRLKHRYIDLRSEKLRDNLMLRHKITSSVRRFLDSNGFIELETPILTKSTPEGARDYLVPSRVNKKEFYALPQSPQLFKQLLMVSGFEKYYQIARCFRDEDLRSDRQPEFTQIDIEMSFADEEDVFSVVESMFKTVLKEVKDYDLITPLKRITYDEAISKYGTDKPDTRFGMELISIEDILANTSFELLKKNSVNAIVVKGKADFYSRKKIEQLELTVKNFNINNLFFLKYDNELTGSIVKNLSEEEISALTNRLKLENNDLVLITAGSYKNSKASLGAVRNLVAKEIGLTKMDEYDLLWVTDFPMFEYSETENRWISAHHPFTMPKDVDKMSDKENCYARSYDLVMNGYELASGSVRIHDKETQAKVFKELNITEKEANEKFGFLLEAFKYGAPPHAGIAPGLERLTMILAGTTDIKDVVAFPKTQSGACLMTEAPSRITNDALSLYGLKEIEDKDE